MIIIHVYHIDTYAEAVSDGVHLAGSVLIQSSQL